MKLIGTKPNETAEQAVIRCANNLVKAAVAAGWIPKGKIGSRLASIDIFMWLDGTMQVNDILSDFQVRGKTAINIAATEYADLIPDEVPQ